METDKLALECWERMEARGIEIRKPPTITYIVVGTVLWIIIWLFMIATYVLLNSIWGYVIVLVYRILYRGEIG